MGALTITLLGMQPSVDGNQRTVMGKMTFSDSYATGGDTFDPIQLGLAQLDLLLVTAASDANPAIITAKCMNTYPLASKTLNPTNGTDGLVAAFAAAGTEEAAQTNLSTFSFNFLAIGV